jgi:hypothetical protein
VQAINRIEHNQVFEYLSRWSLGVMLDSVAREIKKCLEEPSTGKLECTLLYRVPESPPGSNEDPRYIIGGASVLRTAMDPTARRYVLGPDAHKHSFTAHAFRFGQPLAFDDFPRSIVALDSKISHQTKRCELPREKQATYLAIPRPGADFERKVEDALQCGTAELPMSAALDNRMLPEGLLRVATTKKGAAKTTLSLFIKPDGRCALDRIFAILEKGRSALQDPGPLAIADLNSSLLKFRDQEYEGLDALTSHLQTLFGECECSVFRAHRVADEIRLYLAATTALSENEQHKKFRETFFRDREYYTCKRDPSKRGDHGTWHKTQRAFCEPTEPVYEPNCKGKGGFPGHGEWERSTSYLALAIPSRELAGDPYGVIRLVRGSLGHPTAGSDAPFTDTDQKLAGAIAKSLTFWLDLFPRNDDLEIEWQNEALRRETLRILFKKSDVKSESDIARVEIEFFGLLQKLYATSARIEILKSFPGYSGAAVLLVESDCEQTTILKCASKVRDDPAEPVTHRNSITQEVENYREFVEGKIRLNHNVIYPNRIRQTRRVNGFASSFIGSGKRQRVPIADLVGLRDGRPDHFFDLLNSAVRQIIEDIWIRWYERAEDMRSDNAEAFVKEAMESDDCGWHVAENEVGRLNDVLSDANGEIGYPDLVLPSAILKRFNEWAPTSGPVRWARCVTHGDLHGGNIFLDPRSEEVWLIDFARTGRRVSIFDLATLEQQTMLKILPTLLKRRKLTESYRYEFIDLFKQVEAVLGGPITYGDIKLPAVRSNVDGVAQYDEAVSALRGAARVITGIRMQLHDTLKRRGSMVVAPQVVCKRRFGMTPSSRSTHWLPAVQPPLASH